MDSECVCATPYHVHDNDFIECWLRGDLSCDKFLTNDCVCCLATGMRQYAVDWCRQAATESHGTFYVIQSYLFCSVLSHHSWCGQRMFDNACGSNANPITGNFHPTRKCQIRTYLFLRQEGVTHENQSYNNIIIHVVTDTRSLKFVTHLPVRDNDLSNWICLDRTPSVLKIE